MSDELDKAVKRPSLAKTVAVGVFACLVLLGVVLLATKDVWFDHPSEIVVHRMDIIGQLLVGIGTAALAVVTWASVYESQQVIASEDLRFRQSRMPMLRLNGLPSRTMDTAKKPGLQILIQNDGDGAARAVSVRISAKVSVSWSMYSEEIVEALSRGENIALSFENLRPGGSAEVEVDTSWHPAGSYITCSGQQGVFIRHEEIALPLGSTQIVVQHNVTRLEIRYTDVFGAKFRTVYTEEKNIHDLRSFDWKPPKSLVPR